jgi:hypothetical protein
MRYEHHWEYRVFGKLRRKIKRYIRKYQPTTNTESTLYDEYLWAPGCKANIKLRRNKMKFKYLAETTPDGFELWAEDPALKFAFPLPREAVTHLSSQLKLCPDKVFALPHQDAVSFKNALCDLDRRIEVVTVCKKRKKLKIVHHGSRLSIEMTRILKPIPTQTICIEGVDFKRSQPGKHLVGMRNFIKDVDLPRSLEVMGYLQFIGQHARAHA